MDAWQRLWPDGPVFRQAAHFRLSTDSILLADFIRPGQAERGIDLGCGSGILALLLLWKSERLHMTGLELLEEAAELARENLALNALDGRSRVITGDIRRSRELFAAGSFDLAAANPPYFPLSSGSLSPREERALARGEVSCTLEQLCEAAAWLLRGGASFFLVHKPERLSELCCCLSRHGLEPKRLRTVCHHPGAAPSLVLLESRRGGKPGLRIEADLFLCDAEGRESEEYRSVYHRP